MRDNRAGKAVAIMDIGDPARLADLVGAVPFGLAMHGRQHIVAGRIAPVILGQVVASERAVVAHEEIMARRGDEVRVFPLRQVPQMMVRIDQRDRVRRIVPAAVDRVHGFLGHRRTGSACTAFHRGLCVLFASAIHNEIAMRTNVEIDDDLMHEALRLTGLKTKRAAIEEGLKTLVRVKRQMKMLELGGKVKFWDDVIRDREENGLD